MSNATKTPPAATSPKANFKLELGVNAFTADQLYHIALEKKNLRGDNTEILVPLNASAFLVLAEHGFVHEILERPPKFKGDAVRSGLVIKDTYSASMLADEIALRNQVAIEEGREPEVLDPSDYTWAFEVHHWHSMTLSVWSQINPSKTGLSVHYTMKSTLLADRPLERFHHRLYKALLEAYGMNKVPPIFKELATSDGALLLTWEDMGMNSVKSLPDTFHDFSKGNKKIEAMGRMIDGPFSGIHPFPQAGGIPYLSAEVQMRVHCFWRDKLKEWFVDSFDAIDADM